ncbi:MAG: GAF domain-containing protein, partial [Proteobacteria bacterium]|nr:GAF domain-containing protein [Pseudomonadota bacterium]
DITGAEPDDACRIAMDHVLEFVDCDGVNVIRGLLNDQFLTYLTGHGELGLKMVNKEVEFGTGVVGRCHNSGMVMHVTELNDDRLAHMDEDLRPEVKSLLCVPVMNSDGWRFGVVQIINPPADLKQREIDIVAAFAGTLGATLARGL